MLPRAPFVKTAAALPQFALAEAPGNEPLREIPYADVQLTAGPFKQQHDALHAHYLALDNDRLLKGFRIEPIDDQHPETVALMRGPFQYVAFTPTRDLSKDRLTLPSSLKPSGPQSRTRPTPPTSPAPDPEISRKVDVN